MIMIDEAFKATEECLLKDDKPSLHLRVLAKQVWPHVPFFQSLLEQQTTRQSPVHHPEGSVWEHTLLVVDEAAQRKQSSTDPRAFMWAALLHDIGKPATTRVRKGRITAYNHDKKGAEMAYKMLLSITDDEEFAQKTAMLVRYHMQLLYVEKDLPFQDISGMKKHACLSDIALLGYCDRRGRIGADPEAVEKEVQRFLKKCGHPGQV